MWKQRDRDLNTSSAKAKGRRLQDWIKQKLCDTLSIPTTEVRTAIMGESGADVTIHSTHSQKFLYKIECKNQEGMKNLYRAFQQTVSHKGTGEPLLFIKSNHERVLAVVDAEYFIRLHERKQ